MDLSAHSKPSNKSKSNNALSSRKLDSSLSSSFHSMSLNGNVSSGNISLNHSSSKTPTNKRGTKTPNLNKSGGRSTPGGDRFIPDRSNLDIDMSHYLLSSISSSDPPHPENSSSSGGGCENSGVEGRVKNVEKSAYAKGLNETLLGVSDLSGTRVLSFGQKPKCPPEGFENGLKVVYAGSSAKDSAGLNYRVLPKSPERVLDAPDVVDDFYINILDWSLTNVVAIALRDQVYLWKAHTAEITRLSCDAPRGPQVVCSVGWVRDGSHIVVGMDNGTCQVWDVERVKIVRTLKNTGGAEEEGEGRSRIASLSLEAHNLVTGNRRGTLKTHDLRAPSSLTASIQSAHSQEICGVKWSHDGRFIATGGNDNAVNIWDKLSLSSSSRPVFSFTQHLAAVKALCWSPCQRSVLGTGGGTNDRTIKLWNVSSGNMLRSVDCESQVSGLVWSETYKEIVSSHGYNRNHLSVWSYPSMTKVGEILGHSLRILGIALSPDGTTVASVSGDETLRFWRVFPPTKSSKEAKKNKTESSLNFTTHLR